jgi:hypothetical protein
VVVGDLDVCRACGGPGEADAPLVVDADAVLSSAATVQLLETVARWDSQIVDVLSGVEDQEFAISNSLKVGAKFTDVFAIPDELGFFIRERLDHLPSITRCVITVDKVAKVVWLEPGDDACYRHRRRSIAPIGLALLTGLLTTVRFACAHK